MSPVTRKAPPVAEGVNFGDPDIYSGGNFDMPEGDYALEFDVRHHAYTKADGSSGQQMLGVMVTAHPLAGGEVMEHFLSLGKKALASFVPDPDTGKKLLPIPGAPAMSGPPGMTNFKLFLDSLYEAGLPKGTFTNDISVLDGIWVHTANVPEPEQRKQMGAATGEVAQESRNRGPNMTLVVTEIKDDGKPWDGTGGIPEATEAIAPVKAKVAVKAQVKAAAPPAKVPGKKAPAAPPVVEDGGDEEVLAAAVETIGKILEKNPNGLLRLGLRTQTFTQAKKDHGDDMAQAIIDGFFEAGDEALNTALGQHGYAVQGSKIVQAA